MHLHTAFIAAEGFGYIPMSADNYMVALYHTSEIVSGQTKLTCGTTFGQVVLRTSPSPLATPSSSLEFATNTHSSRSFAVETIDGPLPHCIIMCIVTGSGFVVEIWRGGFYAFLQLGGR